MLLEVNVLQPAARFAAGAFVAAVLATACATAIEIHVEGEGAAGVASDPDSDVSGDDPVPEPTEVVPDPVEELSYEDAIDVYFADVERFWSEASPAALGLEFSPVSARIPYDIADDATIPACGGELGPLELYDGNAFYCQPENYIAWDNVGLFPDLYEQFGAFTLGLVISHEYGHAVQASAGFDGPTIFVELQADCLAGAWAGTVARGEGTDVPFARSDLDDAIGGFLTFADPLGTPAADPDAHGTAFDRLNAFVESFEGGVDVCLDYISDPPETATLLVDRADDTEGNLPMDELLPLMTEDLAIFLNALGQGEVSADFMAPGAPLQFGGPLGDPPACGALTVAADDVAGSAYYCEADGQVYIDRSELDELWRIVGDFAPAYSVAHSYAMSIVVEFISDDPAAAVLAADCVVGVWSRVAFDRAALPPEEQVFDLVLSAGDLDEGIVGLLLVPPLGPSLTEPEGLVTFDRAAEFARGFFQGISQCPLS